MLFPYEDPRWFDLMGSSLHPGGEPLSLRLLSLCAFPRGAKILDFGCGPGATLKLLRQEGADALGVDCSESMLARASQHGPVLKGDLRAVPLEDDSLEGGICECVLSQQPRPGEILREVRRLLKAEALFGMTDLFARNSPPSVGGSSESEETRNLHPCAQGTLLREEMEELFLNEGFELLHFEDHSRLLREYAARLVWEGFLELSSGSCGPSPRGYGLWIWRKAPDA